MPRIIYIEHSGTRHEVDAKTGQTVMEAALKAEIPGIAAECGGACSCATCHVYVDKDWVERTGAPSEPEEDMLDFAFDVHQNSRLCCRIRMTDDLDGLIVSIPEKQA